MILPFPQKDYDELLGLINRADRICLLGHIAPDGDALGSTTGFAACLRLAFPKKTISIVVPTPGAKILQSIPGMDEIFIHSFSPRKVEALIHSANLICCMDFQEAKRVGKDLGEILLRTTAPKVLIDHHLNPDISLFALAFSYPPISSTAELTYRLICEIGLKKYIDADIATSLLTGIITDTGCFSFHSDYPEVFLATADLIGIGARKEEIIRRHFHTMTQEQFRLKNYVLGHKLSILPEIHTAYFTLTTEEMKRFHAVDGDTEGFVNEPLDMEQVHYSFFIREREGELKISLRSIGNNPVNDLAYMLFGGGGHLNAAGAEYTASSDPEVPAAMIIESIRKRYE